MFKQLHFKSLLLMLCMTLGAGHAWAQDLYAFYTLDTTSSLQGTNNSYTGNCDIVSGDITWNFGGNSTSNPWRLGGKSISEEDRTVYTKTAMGSAIQKLTLTLGSASGITINSLTLTVASDAAFSDVIDEIEVTSVTTSGDNEFTPSTGTEWAENAYYKFTFNVTVSGTSNKFVQFSKVTFYAEKGENTKLTATASFDKETLTLATGDMYYNVLTTNPEGLAVSYLSDATAVATVASDGTVTAVAAGTANITASWAEQEINGDTYEAGSASYEVTIVEVADGIFNFTTGYDYGSDYGTEGVKVQSGTWTAGNVVMESAGRNCWLNGTSFRIYAPTLKNGEVTAAAGTMTFSVPEGKVITSIVFTGSTLNLMTSDKGTYDSTAGEWTGSANSVTFTASGTNIIETITVTYGDAPSVVAPEFSLAGGYYNGTQSVTLSTATEGATIYYTTDGTEPTAESTEYTGAISVSATATIKAVTVKDETLSAVESATYVIVAHDGTQASPFTVAEANEILNAGFKPTNVYVSGIISQIDEVSTANGNATYWISDDGTTTGQLEIYRGKSYDGEAFTSEDEIAVGDAVTVYGSLTIYGTTNEFAAGSQLVRPLTVDAPAINVEGVSSEILANVLFKSAQTVSITAADGASIYYTTDGTDPTTESSVYDATAGISLDKTATVKAIAVLGTVTSEVASLKVSIYTKGDVSEDGKVSLGDVTELINILLSE